MKRTILMILVAVFATSAILGATGCSNKQTGDDLGAKRAGSDKTAGADEDAGG